MPIVKLPQHTLTSGDVTYLAHKLELSSFAGCLMKDQLKSKPNSIESGVLNLQTSSQEGTHWVAWFKNLKDRYYFDSFGQQPPLGLVKYLKTPKEISQNLAEIKQSSVQVQLSSSHECGALCIYVLYYLGKGCPYGKILQNLLERYQINTLRSHESNLIINHP